MLFISPEVVLALVVGNPFQVPTVTTGSFTNVVISQPPKSTVKPKVTYQLLCQQAESELKAGNYEKALAIAKRAVSANPAGWKGLALEGKSAFYLDRAELSETQLREALSVAPAIEHDGLRKQIEAISFLKAYLQHVMDAEAKQAKGQTKDAATSFAQAFAASPSHYQAGMRAADLFSQAGDYEKEIEVRYSLLQQPLNESDRQKVIVATIRCTQVNTANKHKEYLGALDRVLTDLDRVQKQFTASETKLRLDFDRERTALDTRAAKWRTDADTERRKWTDLEQTRQKQKSDRVQQIQRELRPLQADLSDFQRTLTNDTDNVNRTNREISALRTDLEKVTVGGPRYLEIKKVLDEKLKQFDTFSVRMATTRDKVATTQRRIDFLEGRIDALMY